jgi:hypothetical protein
MVHVIFDGSTVKLEAFPQSGGSGGAEISYFEGLPLRYQRGYGYFVGMPRQRGHGLGSVFKSLWRYLRPMASALGPIAKEAGAALGQEGLATGARMLNQLVEGSTPKEALAVEGREGVKRLLNRASTRLQRGSGGRKRARYGGSHIMLKPGDVVTGHSIARARRAKSNTKPKRGRKHQRLDNLGYY